MFDYKVEDVDFQGLPCIHIGPKKPGHSIMVYYHGWDSSAESSIFRGKILASFGFDVYLPDAPYHGKRKSPSYDTSGDLDWQDLFSVVEQNRQEFILIYEALKEKGPVFVAGHSMGSMTSGAILASYPVAGGLCLNGAFDFRGFARFYGASPNWENIFCPLDHLDAFKGKTVFLGNGQEDTTVRAPYQEIFYHALTKNGKGPWSFVLFEGTSHVVTTNMLEEGLNFLFSQDSHLKTAASTWFKPVYN